MVILSLFDGISCGRIALEISGIRVTKYYSSEIDEKAIIMSKSMYNDIHRLGDVKKWKEWNIDWSSIDLIIGGSPCQSFSRSGDGSGFDGKSGLFYDYIDICNYIADRNPKIKFLLENVVMKKQWENVITEELGVKPILIDSSLVSAQKRQRLYWTNIKEIEQPKDQNIYVESILDFEPSFVDIGELMWKIGDQYVVRNATKQGFDVVNNFDVINLDFPKSKTRRGRVGRRKANTLNTGCNQGVFICGFVKKITPIEACRLQTIPEKKIDQILKSGVSNRDIYRAIGNGWTVKVISHILDKLK